MIVIIGNKKFKAMQAEIVELKQKVNNLEVETYLPLAEATMANGTKKQRVTLQGVVRTIYKKIMKVPMNPIELAIAKSELTEAEAKLKNRPLIYKPGGSS